LEIAKLCCGLRQEILDPETALALDQDDAGTLSKTGSIGGVTAVGEEKWKWGESGYPWLLAHYFADARRL